MLFRSVIYNILLLHLGIKPALFLLSTSNLLICTSYLALPKLISSTRPARGPSLGFQMAQWDVARKLVSLRCCLVVVEGLPLYCTANPIRLAPFMTPSCCFYFSSLAGGYASSTGRPGIIPCKSDVLLDV